MAELKLNRLYSFEEIEAGDINDIFIKDGTIMYGDQKIEIPFTVEAISKMFGKPRLKKIAAENEKYSEDCYIWDEFGIEIMKSNYKEKITSMRIHTKLHPTYGTKNFFSGKVFIDGKEFQKAKWKKWKYGDYILKSGNLKMNSLPENKIAEADDKEFAQLLSSRIEIEYVEPKLPIKLVKYKLEKNDDPELTFSDFNFKLAVIQTLMYEKKILKPEFNVYEFVKEYPKREINIENEGYEPIKEVVDWFKNLQIPLNFADELDEIHMDGGDEIYHQIIPFWDGEDGYFDIKKLTDKDLLQLKKLKKMTVMSEKYEKIAKVLKSNGIEVFE